MGVPSTHGKPFGVIREKYCSWEFQEITVQLVADNAAHQAETLVIMKAEDRRSSQQPGVADSAGATFPFRIF